MSATNLDKGQPANLDLGLLGLSAAEVLQDYRTAFLSRKVSEAGYAEVLAGRAQFSVGGDGKELAQLALCHSIRPGDYRSGYYRDQTWALSLGLASINDFFGHTYGSTDRENEIGTRQMPNHFSFRQIDQDGNFLPVVDLYNTTPDLSPVAAQMPKLVGLSYASVLYRDLDGLAGAENFSRNGDEVAFGTIGNGSCAEGMFWESINSIGSIQCPAVISIWDDGYGISVPNELQHTKGDLSELFEGFRYDAAKKSGLKIYSVKGWDYFGLVEAYRKATADARRDHLPSLVHVQDVTQPLGHSTSGSHERYKPPERMVFERDFDCNRIFRKLIIDSGVASETELAEMEHECRAEISVARTQAWDAVHDPIDAECRELLTLIKALDPTSPTLETIRTKQRVHRSDLLRAALRVLVDSAEHASPSRRKLVDWYNNSRATYEGQYSDHLYSEGADSALLVPALAAQYSSLSEMVPGHQVLNENFIEQFKRRPELITFGQDTGQIGGVNQGMAHMQDLFGPLRVTDAGIRETTIIGIAIGIAQRGFRPIAEIQYLDYLLYCLQLMSDDLASLRWRSTGMQKSPVIIRTRGHRFAGIWHAGSPMAGIINLVRGIHVCVPRDMVTAAGMYNTLLSAGEPALVVEPLAGYRLREKRPDNLLDTLVPLGVPEVLLEGSDVTVVTYGVCCNIAMETAVLLADVGISIEVIDVQTLLPFDRHHSIAASLAKTNKVVFFDEDVPGGTTAFMMQKVIEDQAGFDLLDAEPVTVSSPEYRPAFSSDGLQFTKPRVDTLFSAISDLMVSCDPSKFRNVTR